MQLTWGHKYHDWEAEVHKSFVLWSLDRTPVRAFITLCEVLQGHCEGEVFWVVPDGHTAAPHFSL